MNPHDFDDNGVCTQCGCTEEEVEDGVESDDCPGNPDTND